MRLLALLRSSAFFLFPLVSLASSPLFAQTAAPTEAEIRRLEKRCDDEQHIGCIQQAQTFLSAEPRLPPSQRERIAAKLISAFLALDRKAEARRMILGLFREDPCRKAIAGLQTAGRDLYRSIRRDFLRQDTTPPILSLLLVSPTAFLRDRRLSAQVTDDRKVRTVTLFARNRKDGTFERFSFQRRPPDLYEVTLPASFLKDSPAIEFYVIASDCSGNQASEASPQRPKSIPLQAPGSSGRVIAGGVLLGISAALLVSAGLLFYAVGDDHERWKATFNLEQAENLRQRMILNYGLAWGGIGTGLLFGGIGLTLLLLPAKPTPPDAASLAKSPPLAASGSLFFSTHLRPFTYAFVPLAPVSPRSSTAIPPPQTLLRQD